MTQYPNGYVSDVLSSRLRSENDNNRRSHRRQESGPQLSADQRKSADNQSGVSEENANKRGLDAGHASFDLEMLEETTTEEQELSDRERLAAMLESEDILPSQKGLLTQITGC